MQDGKDGQEGQEGRGRGAEYSRVAASNLHFAAVASFSCAVVVADDIVVAATALVWLLKYLRACRWLHLIVQGGTGCKGQMQVPVARKKRSRAK